MPRPPRDHAQLPEGTNFGPHERFGCVGGPVPVQSHLSVPAAAIGQPPDVLKYAYSSDHPTELSETEMRLLNQIGTLKLLRGTSTGLKAATIDASGRAAPPIQLNVRQPSLGALQDTAPPEPAEHGPAIPDVPNVPINVQRVQHRRW
jgi:hypothetical protein